MSSIIQLKNVILPFQESSDAVDITISDGIIDSIQPSSKDDPSSATSPPPSPPPPSLLLPSLCHPHIHLDKPYILTSSTLPRSQDPSEPDYSDLAPRTGSFPEALRNTSLAKARYTPSDLHRRGAQLLAASARAGVTHARAFVEVDGVAGLEPLRAGAALKRAFAPLVDVQLCAFAQEPLFSEDDDDVPGPGAAANRAALLEALDGDRDGKWGAQGGGGGGGGGSHGGGEEEKVIISALGTTPYVETSRAAALRNIDFAVTQALARGLHLDFHLDYNLHATAGANDNDRHGPPLVHDVIDALVRHGWPSVNNSSDNAKTKTKTVALGHCTRLTRMTRGELTALARRIEEHALPVHFVGLPTSDLFMMGRPESEPKSGSDHDTTGEQEQQHHHRPRGTLQVVSLVREYGLAACLGVNNVGNAFTPFGTGDPLVLASWGVGLYHAGTVRDAALLYGCVSWRARRAIGCEAEEGDPELGRGGEEIQNSPGGEWLRVGSKCPPLLMVRNREVEELPSPAGATPLTLSIPARQRSKIEHVVWDPPDCALRSVVNI